MSEMVGKLFGWVNSRLPVSNTFERHLSKHPVPSKVNFWYLFGALASVVLIIQIVSGIWLIMPYSNTEEEAFASIEYIMRDVDYGWVIRYMHTTGASMFFAVVYLHMFRGLLYGSYQKPKELVWIFGCTIYLAMMPKTTWMLMIKRQTSVRAFGRARPQSECSNDSPLKRSEAKPRLADT